MLSSLTESVMLRKESHFDRSVCNILENNPKLNFEDVLYVITINCQAPKITLEWFIELLRSQEQGVLIEVASVDKALCKGDSSGYLMLLVAFDDKNQPSVKTLPYKSPDEKEELTHSEKQRAMLYFLESLHITEKGVLFGSPHVKLYAGQSILYVCQRESIISQYFALHNEKDLNFLKENWCFSLKPQPINEIRKYFGESIAFYFTFLEFYTKALIGPSLASLSYFLFGSYASPFCAIFNIIWVSLFLKYWKRRSNELAHEWGTLRLEKPEGPRPAFKGKSMGIDPITEKPTPVYPIRKTWMKEYFVSLPLVFVCLYLAFEVMIFYFDVETAIMNYYKEHPSSMESVAVNVPGILYALAVMIMSHFYRIFAEKLNNWENHRTQSSHEAHLIVKLVMFEFVNNFMSVFYVAFYIQDMSMLKWQIGTLLIVNQVVDNLQEVFFPLWTARTTRRELEFSKKSDVSEDSIKVIRESKMPVYENTYFDYLELYIQFGHVFLFASIFPFSPILALINNLIEIHSDAFKLCYGYQRPHQRSADGINGGWMKTFEVMALIAVITNCSLMWTTPLISLIRDYINLSESQLMLATIAIEHVLFALILVINYVIPDLPKGVRIAIAKKSLKKC